jgi:hypothetical protein
MHSFAFQSIAPKSSFQPPNGQHFHFDEGGPKLVIRWDQPTPQEVSDIRRGPCEFALMSHGPVLFFLAKFGQQEWMDAPYSIQMLPPAERTLSEDFWPGRRYALLVCILDTRTGAQCGGRFVSLSPHFSEQLHGKVRHQLREPLTRAEYNLVVDEAFAQFSTAELMLQKSIARTAGGV